MKYLLVTLFLFISFLGFGQSVSAPDSKSFTQSTSGQDASGFVLSGFSATSTLLASISLVNPPTGTTFYLNDTRGLVAASGFTLSGNKTRLVVTGTMASINTALASLKVNTGSVRGNVLLSVATTVNPVGYYYNGVNGHFYRPISTTATYINARTLASQQTFKGQTGYLVTITSADEDAFIFNNVPQGNIWFALSDEASEARWTIDAGPEAGTLIKINNGQLNGNIPGQYNNWAPGEPNNSGNEDYAVTKWSGGSQWNDLPNHFSNPYVIEFGTWTNPDDATFTEFYTNSVTHTNGEVLSARFNIDFGTNIDETKFSAKGYTYTNNNWNVVSGTARQLSGLGKVDLTTLLDTVKTSNGVRATTSAGQVEWAIINPYSETLGGHQLLIDEREFSGTGVSPNDITSIKLFDIYDGPVSVHSVSGFWKTYIMPGNLSTKITSSTFQAQLRLQDGWYGTRAEFSFSPVMSYKQHGMELSYTNQTELNTLYSNIVGVSDVYLAFKELADGGIFGNQSGMGLTNGIQYMNADVDGNGIFNESDTYKLLQHLTGIQSLTQNTTLTNLIKLYNKADYDAITTSNWGTQFNSTRNLIPFTLSGLNNTYNINVTWLGDVNQSHSAQQSITNVSSNSIRSMSLMSNAIIGNPTNFGVDKGNLINIGSLITSGDILDKTTEYRVVFTPISNISDILGLTSISTTDAVNKAGKQLKVKIK